MSRVTGNYPLPRPEHDPRFTFGLTYDVTAVLTAAGYPDLTPADFTELQQALFRFLYAPPPASTLRGVAW